MDVAVMSFQAADPPLCECGTGAVGVATALLLVIDCYVGNFTMKCILPSLN